MKRKIEKKNIRHIAYPKFAKKKMVLLRSRALIFKKKSFSSAVMVQSEMVRYSSLPDLCAYFIGTPQGNNFIIAPNL